MEKGCHVVVNQFFFLDGFTSHTCKLEDSKFFNFDLEYFLDVQFDDVLPYY